VVSIGWKRGKKDLLEWFFGVKIVDYFIICCEVHVNLLRLGLWLFN